MNKKILPFVFIVALALLVISLRNCTGDTLINNSGQESRQENKTSKRGFNRNLSAVEYTAHARCRMDCRKISGADIKEIMGEGKINYGKSDLQDKPCPTYALEGYTDDNEHLRVVFAQCNTKTKVVTCINLDEDFECHCPGDQKGTKK